MAETVINKEDLQRDCEQDLASGVLPSQSLALKLYITNNNTLVSQGLTHVDVQGEYLLTSNFKSNWLAVMSCLIIAPNFWTLKVDSLLELKCQLRGTARRCISSYKSLLSLHDKFVRKSHCFVGKHCNLVRRGYG